MNASSWWLLTAGTVFTTAAVIVFLWALWFGLHRKRWFPLVIITAFWLLAMVIYALVDSSDLEGSSRKRIGMLVIDSPEPAVLVEVNLNAG